VIKISASDGIADGGVFQSADNFRYFVYMLPDGVIACVGESTVRLPQDRAIN